MRKKIENALFELGITPDLVGFNQICSAVEIISNSKGREIAVCEVYENVAKELDTARSRVERGIRHAFTKVDVNSEAFNKYIGINKMTNSALLYTLAYRLKEDNADESRN